MRYDRTRANELLPLLESIGKEIRERSLKLTAIELRLEELEGLPSADENEIHLHVAEASQHRRALRLAKQELERLGCSVVGTAPLTFRIRGEEGTQKTSFVWQTGDPALR